MWGADGTGTILWPAGMQLTDAQDDENMVPAHATRTHGTGARLDGWHALQQQNACAGEVLAMRDLSYSVKAGVMTWLFLGAVVRLGAPR